MAKLEEIKLLLLYPTLVFFLVVVVLNLSSLDLLFADMISGLQGSEWAYRDGWLLEQVLHKSGRSLSVALGLLILLAIIGSYFLKGLKQYSKCLIYLFVSAATGTIIVSLLKRFTEVDCPWDLIQYGGTQEYIKLLDPRPLNRDYGKCFPAGHASAAYCWFGLFFLTRRYLPTSQGYALATVLCLGVLFGATQQLRGAHFISHDIWTAWICWCSAYLWSIALLKDTNEMLC
jgi:membrane-associated PAP2 superfamily phosphatase